MKSTTRGNILRICISRTQFAACRIMPMIVDLTFSRDRVAVLNEEYPCRKAFVDHYVGSIDLLSLKRAQQECAELVIPDDNTNLETPIATFPSAPATCLSNSVTCLKGPVVTAFSSISTSPMRTTSGKTASLSRFRKVEVNRSIQNMRTTEVVLEAVKMSSLRELGELGIIQIMEQTLGKSSRTVVGFGDDVSVVKLTNGRVAVLKTDMLVGSTDVPPGMTMHQLARKAVVANVSDLAAKGVRPLAGLVALGLPARLSRRDVQGIAEGLRDGAKEYGFPLVGGDTNESNDLTISIALFAIADRKQVVLRSGAKSGDIVAVTGEFGSTSAGLMALLNKKQQPKRLLRPLYDAVYKPTAQLELGLRLISSNALTASIDSSDGLAWSLHEISKASNVGIRIDKIPISRAALQFAARFSCNAANLALYGGEEYHLVVTVKRSRFKDVRQASRGKLQAIGVVTNRYRGVRMRHAEKEINIPRKGWEHFKKQSMNGQGKP
jgi:thiamine-monophosphate kinase